MGPQGSGFGYQGSDPCTFHLPPKGTHTYERVCATWSRAFCLARPGKIQLNPTHPELSSSPECALPSRIVKEQQLSTLATGLRCQSPPLSAVSAAIDSRARSGPFPVACPPTPAVGGAGRDRTDGLLLAKQALSQLSYGPAALLLTSVTSMVGLDGFEPSTPALSRRCSNQLSYRPGCAIDRLWVLKRMREAGRWQGSLTDPWPLIPDP